MRLRTLHLLAYGHFADRSLQFGIDKAGLSIVHGPNEAGKSTTLNAITDLRFGFLQNSRAGFLHANQALRIGGVLLDASGTEHALIRRKGRGDTLLVADFSQAEPMGDMPASTEVLRSLDAGLDRDTYLRLFGIDRERMQQGGKNIFEAGGDIGAVLFEASSGSSGVSATLKRFTDEARKLYLPSGNARNAGINQSLHAYREARQHYDEAETRPITWTRLRREHEAAANALSALEAEHVELRERQGLARELLAVRPLLSQIDHERQRLDELEGVPLLSDNAEAERQTIASAIADAAAQIDDEEREIQRLTLILAAPFTDESLLARGRSIRRALASLENLDKLRHEIELARRAEAEACAARRQLAAGISADEDVELVLEQMPTPSRQAEIRERIKQASLASDRLDAHRQQRNESDEDVIEVDETPSLPIKGLRDALSDLRTELDRENAALQRLRNIPTETSSQERLIGKALDTLGLDDIDAAMRVRPVADARIEAAIRQQREIDERRRRLEEDRRRLQTEHDNVTRQRKYTLQQGDITTSDDVMQARASRDAAWATIRADWLALAASPIPADKRGAVADQFDATSRHADDSADRLAQNAEQASRLQQADQMLAELAAQLIELERQAATHARDSDAVQTRWHETLRQSSVPPMPPADLGKWQGKLTELCRQIEVLHRLRDEFAELSRLEQDLAGRLRTALQALDVDPEGTETSLASLASKAERLERSLLQREMSHIDTVARRAEREQQRVRHAAEAKALTARLDAAVSALSGAFAELRLPADASTTEASARLDEYRQLAELNERFLARQRTRQSVEDDLGSLARSIEALQQALDDKLETDLPRYADVLQLRLEAAEKARDDRLRTTAAIAASEKRLLDRQRMLALQREAQARLCKDARVEAPELLVGRIAESMRKRDAQEKLDTALRQLQEASPQRDESLLRSLLLNRSAADLEAEEARCLQALSSVQQRLETARQDEESARRNLQAIDASDEAAHCAEAMEQAASNVAAQLPVWVRLRVAALLLDEALRRFRERAQAPMLSAASAYFERMTDGEYRALSSSDSGTAGMSKAPTLVARRDNGEVTDVTGLSEGTRDQLYLALRLAAVDLRRESGIDMPLILDDVLMSSDDHRTSLILQALCDFAENNQVIILTHHEHVVRIAAKALPADRVTQVPLS